MHGDTRARPPWWPLFIRRGTQSCGPTLALVIANTSLYEWIYRMLANPGNGVGGVLPPSPVLAPGSALGSRPRVALSSAQVITVYPRQRRPDNLLLLEREGPAIGTRWTGPRRGANQRPSATPGSVAATRQSLASSPCRADARTAWGRSLYWAGPTGPRFFSRRSSIARYSRTRGRPQPKACAVCSGASPSRRQWRTRSYWPR